MSSFARLARPHVLALSVLVLSACSSDSRIDTPDPDLPLRDQLQELVDDGVENGLPGVSLHVQHRGESVSVAAGVADRDSGEPVTPSTLFHAASTGKTLVAAMVLRLADMNHLRLDDPIDRWLEPAMSAMITDADRITVRMLLAHTSGIPDYFGDPDYLGAFAESPGKIWTPMEDLGYIDGAPNDFQPGAAFRYSNTNYLLLGVIAERVTGLSLGMALRQWVFEPAGLDSTYGAYETLGQPAIAHGYLPADLFEGSDLDIELPADGSDLDTFAWIDSEGLGDAPVHSTPRDLNAFVRTLIDTDALVSEASKADMLTESFPGSSAYGLGLFILDDGSRFMHGGKAFGMFSSMSYTPSLDSSFTVMANASFGDYDALFGGLVERLLLVLERRGRSPR